MILAKAISPTITMSLDTLIIIGLILTVFLLSCALLWMWWRQRRLERQLRRWQQNQERQQLDIVGLCAAAVRMDERLMSLGRRVGEMHEWAQDLDHQDHQHAHSYQEAIELINQGAGGDELVAECGFSREEAALLIRMHRSHS